MDYLDRKQGLGEEIANSISHGIGFIGAVAITPVLILQAIPLGASAVIGVSIFGLTMMLLYISSTLYHAFPHNRVKRIFQIFDHSAIFLLIAGTYSPFAMIILPGAWGWTIFGIVWALAAGGVVLKSLRNIKTSRLSIFLYLGMGWLGVLAAKPLYENLPGWGLFWLLLGGLLYSLGVIFFANDHRIRYGHFIWHLFVLGGTVSHVVAVLGFVV